MRGGTYLAREVKLTDWSMAGNLSNRSSGVQIPCDICTRLKRYLYSAKCSWIIKHVIGTETCQTRPAWNIHLWRQRYYHYKDTEHDVRGPRLEQSESTVQIAKGKKLKISYTAIYSEASYVDTFWLFKGCRKQTNFKYEVNDARFRKCTEGTINVVCCWYSILHVGVPFVYNQDALRPIRFRKSEIRNRYYL